MKKVKLNGDVVELKVNQAAEVPEWVMLLRRGRSTTVDGVVYQVDDVAMNAMIQAFKENKLDMVIDYDHQSFKGGRAPAAGWIKELNARPDGLWARVEWTQAGREYIANREYRYMSPVFWMDDNHRPVTLANAALTNNPRIKDYPPIVNRRSDMNFLQKLIGIFGLDAGAGEEAVAERAQTVLIENSTLHKALASLRALVGLDDKAGPDKVTEQVSLAVNKGKAGPGTVVIPNSTLTLLGLATGAGESEVNGAIQGLKAGSGQHAQLVAEINALKAREAERNAREMVEVGIKAGKIIPSQKEWALGYAAKDAAGFQAYLNNAPQVVPVTDLAGGPASQGGAAPDGLQRQINTQLSISPEDFKKYAPKAGGEEE